MTRGSGHRFLGAITAAAVAAAVAACGPAPSASPATAPPASATPAPATPVATPTPGAATTPLPRGAFTVDLPDGWRSVAVDADHEDLLAELAAQNAAFAESLGARLTNLADTATYVAFDGSPAAVTTGTVVTLTVTEVDLPLEVGLTAFAQTIQGQVEQLIEGDVELRRILVTAGEAYSMAYLAPVTRPDGEPAQAAVTQVFYVLPGRGYVLTFAAPPDRANDYAKAVADIATSFMIRL